MNLNYFVIPEYHRIMSQERSINAKMWSIPDAAVIAQLVVQLEEYAKNAFVLRSYNYLYGLTEDSDAYESTGAHTNLMRAILDRALSYLYGPDLERNNIPGGYSYREIIEAVGRHDLPENLIGDQPDNGNRDEVAKIQAEHKYQNNFSNFSPTYEANFEKNVKKLLTEMETKSTEIGKMLYLADKVSAIFIALAYDATGKPPRISSKSNAVSERDLEEMRICGNNNKNLYFASEMWTTDYLSVRKIVHFDNEGFFTALIVMYTLILKNHWYAWREREYLEHNS